MNRATLRALIALTAILAALLVAGAMDYADAVLMAAAR